MRIEQRPLPTAPPSPAHTQPLSFAISQFLQRKRHRIAAVDEAVRQAVVGRVERTIARGEPLYFYIGLGCYKSPRLPDPAADWAEVLQVKFMGELISSIAQVYPPGVILEYSLADVGMDLIATLAPEAVERYAVSFSEIVQHFAEQLPPNARIVVSRLSGMISVSQFQAQADRALAVVDELWARPDYAELAAEAIARSRRNYIGGDIPDQQIVGAAKYHLACLLVEDQLEHAKFERGICFVHRSTLKSDLPTLICLPYKSCPTSAVQFWVGHGCLLVRPDRYIPAIVSPQQLAQMTSVGAIPCAMLPASNPNLASMPIYIAA